MPHTHIYKVEKVEYEDLDDINNLFTFSGTTGRFEIIFDNDAVLKLRDALNIAIKGEKFKTT